jgi:hypothetical protein
VPRYPTQTGPDVMVAHDPIDWTGVDLRIRTLFEGQVSAVVRSAQEAEDLVRFFGGERNASFQPYYPVLLVFPGYLHCAPVQGAGVTTVAELRDLCVHWWGRTEERLRQNGGRLFDFAALRDEAGYPQREDADAMVRQAMRDAAARHKANPITNPGRDPMRDTYPRQSFPVSESGDVAWPL